MMETKLTACHLIQSKVLILIHALVQLINLLILTFLNLFQKVVNSIRFLIQRIVNVLQLHKNPAHHTGENRYGKRVAESQCL